jgi:nickel/cobalt transporter (NicO) family protein
MLRRSLPLALLITLGAFALAHAQSPLGVGSAEPSFNTGGIFGPFFGVINAYQQSFYRALTGALKAMRQDPWAVKGLVTLSFAYGVFHAAGPGHGKAVISSYMIANETALKRGIVISLVSALLQGVVAIGLVAAAYIVLRGTGITMTRATQAMEVVSFAMIALFGGWLMGRKLYALRPHRSSLPIFASASPASGPTGLSFRAIEVGHDHDQLAAGDYCVDCGQMHLPDPQAIGGRDFSLHEAWSAIVAVGLRPCSGAILVMSFSILNGLYLGGALSVLFMSLGTAITVSLLALIAVSAKDLAVRYVGKGSRTAGRITNGIEIVGALFILLMGLSLLGAALQA